MKTATLTSLAIALVFTTQCKFDEIDQPNSAQLGEVIEVSITVYDNIVPEPNPHKGLLCILLPQDWSFISGEYSGSLGAGQMEIAPNWADSAEACYPASEFGDNMKWIGMTSDTGYTYEDPITVNVVVRLQVGQTEGCFKLGYLVTKATGGLIGAGDPTWAPFSYPHSIGVPDSCYSDTSYAGEPAPEWDDLFDRDAGWTGADGIYAIPLSGLEIPSDSIDDKTLFLFSDTFIGEVDSNGRRHNATLINNTLALLEGRQPITDQISFFWETQNNKPKAVFVPETPNSNPGDWYWLMDGISLNDKIYVFALRLQEGSGGVFNFEVVGVSLVSCILDSTNFISNCEQFDTPLYHKNEAEGWEIVLGQAVMPMTDESGNPNPDGYVYVYGPRNQLAQKELVAARVLPDDFEDFSEWQYWDGENWSTEIEDCTGITDGISQEFSVTPLDDGQFALVFQLYGLSSQVAIRFGDSPTGPFDFYEIIYDCPEVQEDPDIFVYNAKAHPHLSNPEELLISYNVNTFDFWDHFSNADIYRPRFIKLQLSGSSTPISIDKENQTSKPFSLLQNYPNPFNTITIIQYVLPENAKVKLKIYNMLGQEVRTLVNQNQTPDTYFITWDGRNNLGQKASPGVYFYRVQVNEKVKSRKIILLN